MSEFRSSFTDGFAAALARSGGALLVSTYQAGKVAVVRAAAGGGVNTHFRDFAAPMGLAYHGGRLAVGTAWQVWEFHDVPAAAAGLPPAGSHDGCFLPRVGYVTGNIQVHDLAWAGDELWAVNTRFSCLCTVGEPAYSFRPRWRPPFVSALAAEDRCHLNGLCAVGGEPRYVTALGPTDAPAGWRAGKADGGVLVDVRSGEVAVGGLSMPHSPRWHAGRLWACESGAGTVGVVDPPAGRYDPVAAFPGFTRGLDFAAGVGFVGLSQVRESAVFSGIPLVDRVADRACGVWAFDPGTGATLGFLRFEGAVQEIFAVVAVPHRHPDLFNHTDPVLTDTFVLPDDAPADPPA